MNGVGIKYREVECVFGVRVAVKAGILHQTLVIVQLDELASHCGAAVKDAGDIFFYTWNLSTFLKAHASTKRKWFDGHLLTAGRTWLPESPDHTKGLPKFLARSGLFSCTLINFAYR